MGSVGTIVWIMSPHIQGHLHLLASPGAFPVGISISWYPFPLFHQCL